MNEQRNNVIFGAGLLAKAAQYLTLDRRVLVVTDDGVPARYAETLAAQCARPTLVCLPQGEASKSFAQLQALLSAMLQNGFGRGDCVVAVGGGMVGDLSGFAAACYMRGVDFYNIPTTLLSQLDSSVGGKTAIDFEGVKNIVGAFYPPKKVLIDAGLLETLPDRQLAAGIAEAIKIAAVRDTALFETIEALPNLRADLTEIIRRGVENKLDVVEADPLENGLRRILNFGHTIGHAIEAAADGALLHGECVALGMLPMCSAAVRARLEPLLARFGLPTKTDIAPGDILQFLTHDKKAQGQVIKTVYVEHLGSYQIRDMHPEELLRAMEDAL